jgi:hypothetical protein
MAADKTDGILIGRDDAARYLSPNPTGTTSITIPLFSGKAKETYYRRFGGDKRPFEKRYNNADQDIAT